MIGNSTPLALHKVWISALVFRGMATTSVDLSGWRHGDGSCGLSIKRLLRTLERYRTFDLTIAGQSVHVASPVPPKSPASSSA